eukprot:scaffold109685_cov48-Prasinocladus_malaysianus.AAC.2
MQPNNNKGFLSNPAGGVESPGKSGMATPAEAGSPQDGEGSYTPLSDPELEKARRELLRALRAATTPEGQARQLRSPSDATATPACSPSPPVHSSGMSPARPIGLSGESKSPQASPVSGRASIAETERLEDAW